MNDAAIRAGDLRQVMLQFAGGGFLGGNRLRGQNESGIAGGADLQRISIRLGGCNEQEG